MSYFNSEKYQSLLKSILKYIPSFQTEKKVLITGATGMIGSCLVDCYIKYNRTNDIKYKIVCNSRNIKKLENRFSYLRSDDNVSFIEGDVSFISSTEKYDFIFHTASNADPISHTQSPKNTILPNILGTYNLLQNFTNENSIFIYFSTMEVYGESIDQNYINTENSYGLIDFNQFRSSYAISKQCSEILCKISPTENVKKLVIRPSYVYGPTMRLNDSRAVSEFIVKASRSEDILLKSSGQTARSHCFIMDLMSGVFFLIDKGISGESYNITSVDSDAKILEFAKLCSLYSNSQLSYKEPTEEERKGYGLLKNLFMSNHKITSLGWNSEYSLDLGIKLTLDILKE